MQYSLSLITLEIIFYLVISYSVPSQINRKSMWPMKLDPSSRGPGVLSCSPKGALQKPKEEGYPHSNELPHSNPTRGWVSTPHRLRRHLGRWGVRRQPGHPAQLQPCPLLCSEPTPAPTLRLAAPPPPTGQHHWRGAARYGLCSACLLWEKLLCSL